VTTSDWDAQTYHRVAQPHLAWGTRVVDRLVLKGDETVLDAGCGSGGVTQQLLGKLPNGHVIAADRSASMLAEARANLAAHADRVTFIETDLLNIEHAMRGTTVDAVLSTATFHWIEDHAALFKALHAITRPGGQLVAQCGGGTNLARFAAAGDAIAERNPYAEHLHGNGKRLWRHYYGTEDTRARLAAAGYTDINVWLEDSPQRFASQREFEEFCRTVVLSRHVAALPAELQDGFVHVVADEVHQREGGYVLDYVRLNFEARHNPIK
jgi:trans-aconitate 2-methyltransferase